MAFSKELEEVIEAALADGVLTDKERAVLHKKAVQEGVDPDELDVVIDGRLAKMKHEVDWLKPAPPASEKRGNIVKCPNCGAPIEAGAVSCKECGYVFTNVSANRSSEKLAEKISSLLASKRDTNHIVEEIKNFPLPTSKEDLMEFIASMDAKRKEQGPLQQAYRTKFKEAIIKAKTFFSDDTQIMGMVKSLDKFSVSTLTKLQKTIWAAVAVVIVIVIIMISNIVSNNIAANEAEIAANKAEPLAKAQYEKLVQELDAIDTPNEANYKTVESQLLKIVWTDIDGDKSSYKNNYLQKKRALANLIGAVEVSYEWNGKIKHAAYKYHNAPDEIRDPEYDIKN